MDLHDPQHKAVPPIRIFYQNANKRYEAALDIARIAEATNCDFMLTTEPYVSKDGNVPGFTTADTLGTSGTRATAVNRTRRVPSRVLSSTTRDITVCALDLGSTTLVLVCAFLSPCERIEPYLDKLTNIVHRYCSHPIVMIGDFNARHSTWVE